MRIGNSACDRSGEANTRFARCSRKSRLRCRPLGQVLPSVFTFEIVWRRLEVPFKDTNKLLTFAQALAEKPKDCSFTLQAFESRVSIRKLEDSQFLSLGVTAQPDRPIVLGIQ